MKRFLAALLLALPAALPGLSAPHVAWAAGQAEIVAHTQDCVTLAAQAEPRYAIPTGILQAIALVESGLHGKAWPWTINAGGTGYYLTDRATAVATANAAVRRFGPGVAVGCMQISLKYHAAAFPTMDRLVDADNNVDYAARLLASMHQSYGSWTAAVQHYGASQPQDQAEYLCRVVRARTMLGYQASPATACGS